MQNSMEDYDTKAQITEVHIASDHAGFRYKELIADALKQKGYEVVDHGAFENDKDDDYPDFIAPAALAVTQDPYSRAIIIGGSGQGEAILANRFPGVRAMVFVGHHANKDDLDEVVTGRQHNDANILSLGARFLSEEEVLQAVESFLDTDFSGDDRHVRRIAKIEEITKMIGK